VSNPIDASQKNGDAVRAAYTQNPRNSKGAKRLVQFEVIESAADEEETRYFVKVGTVRIL
jgi:hypothetical protein